MGSLETIKQEMEKHFKCRYTPSRKGIYCHIFMSVFVEMRLLITKNYNMIKCMQTKKYRDGYVRYPLNDFLKMIGECNFNVMGYYKDYLIIDQYSWVGL